MKRGLLFLFWLLAMVAASPASATLYGCVRADGMYSPTPSVIEYWIDDSIALPASTKHLGNLTGDEAVAMIRVTLDRFHRDTGARVYFKYMGISTDKVCHGGSNYNTPTYIIQKETNCSAFGGAIAGNNYLLNANGSMKCSNTYLKRNSVDCPAHHWGAYADENPAGEDSLMKVFTHETMHALGFDHVQECMDTDDDDAAIRSGFGTTDEVHRSLTRADKRYVRSHYGYDNVPLEYLYSTNFEPSSWTAGIGVDADVVSPTDMASSDDGNRGVVYLKAFADSISEARAYICEPSCSIQTPSALDTFTAPALTTSVGQATEHWLVAALYNDSFTSIVKDIYVAEKDHGGANWTVTSLDVNTERTVVSADYDKVSDTYIVGYLNNSDEMEFRVRSRTGGSWAGTDSNIRAFEGSSVACDEVDSEPDGNCVAVWASIEANTGIRWARFRVDMVSHAITFGTIRSAGWPTIARPTIVNRWASNTNPEFLMGFSQGGLTTYTRTLTDSGTTWGGGGAGTFGSASSDAWYSPASVGQRIVSGANYSYMYFGE